MIVWRKTSNFHAMFSPYLMQRYKNYLKYNMFSPKKLFLSG